MDKLSDILLIIDNGTDAKTALTTAEKTKIINASEVKISSTSGDKISKPVSGLNDKTQISSKYIYLMTLDIMFNICLRRGDINTAMKYRNEYRLEYDFIDKYKEGTKP